MPCNKPRLYLALYARGGEGYHWALLIGPKHEHENSRGTLYHAKQEIFYWRCEQVNIAMGAANMILVRVLAAKVQNVERVKAILGNVPVRPNVDGWTDRSWVEEAYEKLRKEGEILGACADWEKLSDTGLEYVERKKEGTSF